MSEAGRAKRRRIIRAVAASAAVAAIAAAVWARGGETRWLLLRTVLVAGSLFTGWMLVGAVRRGLAEERTAALRASYRGNDRTDVPSAVLQRIHGEIARARESREGFAEALAPRLLALAERRARCAGGGEDGVAVAPAAPPDAAPPEAAGRGLTVEEIGRIVGTIEER